MNKKRTTRLFITFCLILSLLVPSFSALAETRGVFGQADRVYFFNMAYRYDDRSFDGDFIIVESQGHYGLIDTGHRYADTIEDEDGTVYSAEVSRNLSSQTPYKNGRDAAQYMIDSLGVEHLDFIIGTHAHSDHIGGVPEIAELTFEDANGETRQLVDENTVYFYKNYAHINNTQDDYAIEDKSRSVNPDDTVKTWSWHNQAYVYQAVSKMREQGSALAELSHDVTIVDDEEPEVSFDDTVSAINSVEGLSSARYYSGDTEDFYDDFVSFRMGNLSIRLYNLFQTATETDDNVNSLVTVITDGSKKVVSLADINVENRTEQKLAQAIYEDIGTADVVKAAHHGTVRGSNSRGMLEYLQPKNMVVTREVPDNTSNAWGAFSCAMVYARKNYNTTFYEVGWSDFGVVATFSKGKVVFNNLSGIGANARLTSPDKCRSQLQPRDDWSRWTVEMGNPDVEEYCYFSNGVQIANWREGDDGYWYYIDEHSQYHYGWLNLNGTYYYLAPDTTMGYPLGAMVTGWNYINGKWYCFDEKGWLANGWTKLEDGWYYFNSDSSYLTDGWHKVSGEWYYFNHKGVMQTGWLLTGGKRYYLDEKGIMLTGWMKVDGVWYYADKSGAVQSGWQKIGNVWYYFTPNGAMQTGWQKIGGRWYYFAASGAMQMGWQKIDGIWYYFDTTGAMKTGWFKDGSKWYYFAASGAMQTGWQQLSGTWYYFDASGAMATGTKTISGKQYTFNSSGAWVK